MIWGKSVPKTQSSHQGLKPRTVEYQVVKLANTPRRSPLLKHGSTKEKQFCNILGVCLNTLENDSLSNLDN